MYKIYKQHSICNENQSQINTDISLPICVHTYICTIIYKLKFREVSGMNPETKSDIVKLQFDILLEGPKKNNSIVRSCCIHLFNIYSRKIITYSIVFILT